MNVVSVGHQEEQPAVQNLHQNESMGQLANAACLLLMVSARAILKMPYVMKELVKFIDEKENVLECHRRTSASASASKRSSRARTAACVRYIQHDASLLCYGTLVGSVYPWLNSATSGI